MSKHNNSFTFVIIGFVLGLVALGVAMAWKTGGVAGGRGGVLQSSGRGERPSSKIRAWGDPIHPRPVVSPSYLSGLGTHNLPQQRAYIPRNIPLGDPVPANTLKVTSLNVDVINPGFSQSGVLTTTDETDDTILNLFRRPISPRNELWEYYVEDKDGFRIKLQETYLEDGDIVASVPGKEAKGSWLVRMYSDTRYVWV